MPAAYIIRADDPAYMGWQAAAASRRATILGYSYDPDGVKKMAVTEWHGKIRRNPDDEMMSVSLGEDFLTKALDDYSNWNQAWWREAIQNSVDAGATRIDMTTEMFDDGKFCRVTVTDNGKGMSWEILTKKFLSLGSSGKKDAPSATGGFGEAKRLLLFPWCSWSVLSSGSDGPIGVVGHGFNYKKTPGLQAEGTGTQLIVVMPKDKHVDACDAELFIERCYLPGIKLYVNGKRVYADLDIGHQVGEEIVSADYMLLYYSPKARTTPGFYIRKNGLLMYREYAPDLKGTLIGEIVPPSVQVLQSNRDGLRYSTGKSQVDHLLSKLSKNVSSALKKSKRERTLYEGTKISAEITNATGKVFIALQDHFGAEKNKNLEEQISKSVELEVAMFNKAIPNSPGVFAPTPGVAKLILPASMGEATQIEAAAAQLVWPADFYIVNEIDDYRVPKELRPEGMKAGARKAARLWLEYCRLILIRLGYKAQFGIGWHFSTASSETHGYTRASYVKDQGRDWLLLNPYVDGNMDVKKIFSIRDDHHLNDLFSLALHECTHLVNHISDHDESFTSALTRNIGLVLPSAKLLLGIRNAVAARTGDDDDA